MQVLWKDPRSVKTLDFTQNFAERPNLGRNFPKLETLTSTLAYYIIFAFNVNESTREKRRMAFALLSLHISFKPAFSGMFR